MSPLPGMTPSTIAFSVRVPDSAIGGPPSDDEFLVEEPGSGMKVPPLELQVSRISIASLEF